MDFGWIRIGGYSGVSEIMRTRLFKVVLEVEDFSESDGSLDDVEDVESAIEEVLEYLPSDLKAHVVEVSEGDDA